MEAALLEEFATGDAREREESWRYSRAALRALAQQDFVDADAHAEPSPALRERAQWGETQGARLVFVNGAVSAALSDFDAAAAAAGFVTAADGRFELTVSATPARPLHLVYFSVAGDRAARWRAHGRIRVRAGSATIVEQHLGDAGADVLGALTTAVEIDAGAAADFVTLGDLPASCSLYRRVDAQVGEGARLDAAHALFGARLQRFDLGVHLAGERARFVSRGAFALRGREHADLHFDVRHRARDTACDVLWRGVADERARGVFHGAITVESGADGADAQLSNKNLLLSANAEIDTQPVLEIHADEVKAAHGATVGQLDEQALFYLRSRGLPLDVARRVLIGAFCRVPFADLAEPLRERIDAALAARLFAAEAVPA